MKRFHTKSNSFQLALCLAAMLITMIACGTSSGRNGGPSAGTLPPAHQGTQPPAQPSSSKYFQEDFSTGPLDNWSHFVVDSSKALKGGKAALAPSDFGTRSLAVKDGFLAFDLESQGQWVYATYDAQQYDDVRVDVSAENRGNSKNNTIALFCRYSPSQGWYMFWIGLDNGSYGISLAQIKADKTYDQSDIDYGTLTHFKPGKDTNQIGITCLGHTLSLSVNGAQEKKVDDTQYGLKSGKIGVALTTFDAPPAIVGFKSVKVSQP